MHQLLLILHLLAACVWVGGHIILLFRYVPTAYKENSIDAINVFRKKFEPLGIPSLLLLIITGILMAYDYNVSFSTWFSFSSKIERVISLKLILITITVISAIVSTRFIFPNLKGKVTPVVLVFISLVTLIAVIMVVLGSTIRYGGI